MRTGGDHVGRFDGFWQDRSVAITGAGGFVASWLSKALIELGASVVGIVRDSAGDHLLDRMGVRSELNIVHGSITDLPLVERVLNEYEVDTCFHLAAQAIVGAANRSPLSTFESNIKGTWNVLEAARTSPSVRAVVVASSDKAYGDQPTLPYREDLELRGRYPYDASKVCAEVLARCFVATYDAPVSVLRCANTYGGGDLNWSRLIPGTIRSILRGEEPVIRSDGTLERDYLFVEDAIRAYLLIGMHATDDGVRGEAFNFGTGHPVSVIDLVRKILFDAGSDLQPLVLGPAKGEIDRQYLDSTLARTTFGWESEVDLDQGLARTIAWYSAYLGLPVAVRAELTSGR